MQRQIEQTTDYYMRQRTNTKKEVDRYRKNYLENSDSGLGYYNQIKGTNFANADEARKINKEAFDKFFYGPEGLVPLSDASYKMMNQSTKDWATEVRNACRKGQKAYQKYDNNVSEIANSVNGSLKSIIEGQDEHSGLINTKKYTDELNQSVNTSAKKYNTCAKRIQTNINKQSKLFKTLNSKAAKAAIKKPAKMADNLLNAKANAKALYEYINNNKDLAIKPMEEMSSKARQLRDDWNGVYKAAKRAIAQESKSGGPGGGGGSPTGSTTTDTSITYKKLKKAGTIKTAGKKYTVYKGSDGNFYTSKKGGTAYSSKEAAINAKHIKKNAKKGEFEESDINKTLNVKKGVKAKAEIPAFASAMGNFRAYSTKKAFGFGPATQQVISLHPSKFKNGELKILQLGGVAANPRVLLSGVKGKIKAHWYNMSDVKKYFTGFDTGGYTGSWNNKNGKLAMLHQKEIVLNKQDTANFLQAVKLTRMFAQDLGKYKTGLVDKIAAISNNNKMINTNNSIQSQALQQDININATFPNVSSSSEIEKAFQQLSAKATQYAWSNKIK